MKKIFTLLFVTILFSITAFADIPYPRPPEPNPSATPTPQARDILLPLDMSVSPNLSEPALPILHSAGKTLRAQPDTINGGNPNSTTTNDGFSLSQTQSLMSGLFLSLAIIFGGIWFARGKILYKSQQLSPRG